MSLIELLFCSIRAFVSSHLKNSMKANSSLQNIMKAVILTRQGSMENAYGVTNFIRSYFAMWKVQKKCWLCQQPKETSNQEAINMNTMKR